MRVVMMAAAAALVVGCAQTPQMVKDDPGQRSITIETTKAPRDAFQLLHASVIRCAGNVSDASAAFVDASNTGQLVMNAGNRVETVIDVKPSVAGSTVVIYPNLHFARQARAWPALVPLWIDQGDTTTCIQDVL